MLQPRGGARTDGAGCAPLGFIQNFNVPDELLARRSVHGVVVPDEALRRAEPDDRGTGDVSFRSFLSDEDADLLKQPIIDFQTRLAAGLRQYVGTDIGTAVRQIVGAHEARRLLRSSSMAGDASLEPLFMPLVVMQYFLVPGWYKYVMHIHLRIDEAANAARMQLVPAYPDTDTRAPLFITVTTTSESVQRHARAPTFL